MAMKDSALAYFDAGIKVTVSKRQSKRSLVSPQVAAAWTRADLASQFDEDPTLNIAILTGAVNHLLVVDVDNVPLTAGDGSGFAGFAAFTARYGALPATSVKCLTPGGGYHLYYNMAPQEDLVTVPSIMAGVDIRADNGYVTAPPSVARDVTYQWDSTSLIAGKASLPNAPDWLINLATRKYQEGEPKPTFTTLYEEKCWDYSKIKREESANKSRADFVTEDWDIVRAMYDVLIVQTPVQTPQE